MLRRIIAGIAVACAVNGLSFAQTNLSSRPVGFIKINVPASGYVLASVPFRMLEGGEKELRSSLNASSDPDKSDCLMLWNNSASKYITLINAGTNWMDRDTGCYVSDFTLFPSEGFIIQNKQNADIHLTLSGELVLDDEITTVIQPELNLVGFPYSSVPKQAALSGMLTNEQIKIGKGYWVNNRQGAEQEITEKRPYDNSFGDSLPTIRSLNATADGAVLAIMTTGQSLDIYGQDLSTNGFNSVAGWQILAQDITVTSPDMQWQDNTSGGTSGRYYLVCRSDIDADNNGIPDAREIFVLGTKNIPRGQAGGTLSDIAVFAGSEDGVTNSITSTGSTNNLDKADKKIAWTRVLYVSKSIGRDTLSGLTPVVRGKDGPKKQIKEGLKEASAGDIVIIKSGHYAEDISIAGKDLTVRIDGDVDISGGNNLALPSIESPHSSTNNISVGTNSVDEAVAGSGL